MSNVTSRLGWVIAAALGLALVAVAAQVVSGGPLDPPQAPASTGRPIDEAGAWDRRLLSTNGAPNNSLFPPPGCNSSRFKCVLTHCEGSPICVQTAPAVLDLETGLVWERVPSATVRAWAAARAHCAARFTGLRSGWRLPAIEEIRSLADTSADGLPDGHPFVVPDGYFWSSTSESSTNAAVVDFPGSESWGTGVKTEAIFLTWCVRGGYGHDVPF